jgi:hypothetical protein|tara:strand:- start:814 stop:1152 length:339 start_codon:yes stop_codon:yes gene_type:complete
MKRRGFLKLLGFGAAGGVAVGSLSAQEPNSPKVLVKKYRQPGISTLRETRAWTNASGDSQFSNPDNWTEWKPVAGAITEHEDEIFLRHNDESMLPLIKKKMKALQQHWDNNG